MIANFRRAAKVIERNFPRATWHFLAISAMILCAGSLSAATPLLLRAAINNTAGAQGLALPLFLACGAYVFCWALAAILDSLKGIYSASFLAQCDAAINGALLRHIFRYDNSDQSSIDAGRVSSEVERASSSFSAMIVSFYWTITPIILEFVVAAVVLGKYIGPWGALYFCLGGLLIGSFAYAMALKSGDIHARLFSARSDLAGYTVERLGLLYDIRINMAHERELKSTDSVLHRYVSTIRDVNREMGFRLVIMAVLLGLFLAGAIAYLAYGAHQGERTAGDFALAGGYSAMLAAKLRLLAGAIIDLGRSNLALERGLSYLDKEISDHTGPCLAMGSDRLPGFVLDNVEILLNGAPLFKPVQAHIRKGAMTVICGPSGVGKSTLINAMLGIHDLNGGEVLFDGARITQKNSSSILHWIAVAPQTAAVFSGTLRQNLIYGLPDDVSDESILDLIKMLRFSEEAGRPPLSSETRIGTGGRQLSGGERQRVSIGRALLRNKSVIVLDEPTAALDRPLSLDLISEIKNKTETVIVVSHDPSIIEMAEYRLVLER